MAVHEYEPESAIYVQDFGRVDEKSLLIQLDVCLMICKRQRVQPGVSLHGLQNALYKPPLALALGILFLDISVIENLCSGGGLRDDRPVLPSQDQASQGRKALDGSKKSIQTLYQRNFLSS